MNNNNNGNTNHNANMHNTLIHTTNDNKKKTTNGNQHNCNCNANDNSINNIPHSAPAQRPAVPSPGGPSKKQKQLDEQISSITKQHELSNKQ